jgi:hypothetical protein|tara:strand:+ start:334 stop:525 length:192 start_codon:yes stop_codon:yes gene_type:complete
MHSQFGGGDFGFGVSRGSVGGGGSSSEISSGSSDFMYIFCNTVVSTHERMDEVLSPPAQRGFC